MRSHRGPVVLSWLPNVDPTNLVVRFHLGWVAVRQHSQTLANAARGFKSPLMRPAWGATWNVAERSLTFVGRNSTPNSLATGVGVCKFWTGLWGCSGVSSGVSGSRFGGEAVVVYGSIGRVGHGRRQLEVGLGTSAPLNWRRWSEEETDSMEGVNTWAGGPGVSAQDTDTFIK